MPQGQGTAPVTFSLGQRLRTNGKSSLQTVPCNRCPAVAAGAFLPLSVSGEKDADPLNPRSQERQHLKLNCRQIINTVQQQ